MTLRLHSSLCRSLSGHDTVCHLKSEKASAVRQRIWERGTATPVMLPAHGNAPINFKRRARKLVHPLVRPLCTHRLEEAAAIDGERRATHTDRQFAWDFSAASGGVMALRTDRKGTWRVCSADFRDRRVGLNKAPILTWMEVAMAIKILLFCEIGEGGLRKSE